MLELSPTNNFDKSMKLAKKRGKDLAKALEIIDLLRKEKPLPARAKDHPLIGNYRGTRECKIEPDWLLVYYVKDGKLHLVETGTHADLFD